MDNDRTVARRITLPTSLATVFTLAAALVGCSGGATGDVAPVVGDVAIGNGGRLAPLALSMNGLSMNGLRAEVLGQGGLGASGMAEQALGSLSENAAYARFRQADPETSRELMTYVVRCALGPSDHVNIAPPGAPAEEARGELGLAPGWSSGPLDAAGRGLVSACLMAHVNELGAHVRISLRGASPALKAATTSEEVVSHPFREGAFYGDVFTAAPDLRVCSGEEALWGGSQAEGRVCTKGGECGFHVDGPCAAVCSRVLAFTADGMPYEVYGECKGTSQVITTFLAP